MKSTANVIGLDIAKNVFVAVGRDLHGKVVWKKTLARDEVLAFFDNLPPMAVGIEACSGSHYWPRQLNALGHEAKLIAAQHTRAYVSGNKNAVKKDAGRAYGLVDIALPDAGQPVTPQTFRFHLSKKKLRQTRRRACEPPWPG